MLRFNEHNEIIRQEACRAILCGIGGDEAARRSMEELDALARAADMDVLGTCTQAVDRIHSATVFGRGKVEEIAQFCDAMEADVLIFDGELSGIQIRNLEEKTAVLVIDRTILILDLFARRAMSREGQLQVELAQLSYRLPRLMGFGRKLSRLGGGIGTRGPGEKKLETDRRHILRRMAEIRGEIAQVQARRKVMRARRERNGMPVVALVGYTNAGKSAVMNRMLQMYGSAEKTVASVDQLFATLDTRQRRIDLGQGEQFVLVDTVGFVSRLPHSLVAAFRATLEEVADADLLIDVVDGSDPERDFQIQTTQSVLEEIGADGIPCLTVFNKCDLADGEILDETGSGAYFISALRGDGMEELLGAIRAGLFADRQEAVLLVPYTDGASLSYVCRNTQVLSMEYLPEGTKVRTILQKEDHERLRDYDTL